MSATTCSLAYRENGATQFTPVGSVESGERAVIGGLLASKSYEIRATVTDGITTESKSVFLSGNTVTMDFLANGKGVAFGCEATKEGFECAMSATFTPPIPNESLDAAPRDHTHDYAASGHKHSAGDITSGTLPSRGAARPDRNAARDHCCAPCSTRTSPRPAMSPFSTRQMTAGT